MLVLSRRLGESLRIGDDIVIEVLRADEGKGEAVITITAPTAVRVSLPEDRKQGVIITHKRRSRLAVQSNRPGGQHDHATD